MEYAFKATDYASDNEDKVFASWDRFASDIDENFGKVSDKEFVEAVDYLLTNPPHKQIRNNGVLTFTDQVIDGDQKSAQQTIDV